MVKVDDKYNDQEYLLQDDGTPYRTADGTPIMKRWFDNEPTFDPEIYERSDEEVNEELERLGLPLIPTKKKEDK